MASYCNPVVNFFTIVIIIVVYGCVSAKALLYTITCDRISQANCQNETLSTILNSIEGDGDVHIHIQTPDLQLDEVINITGLNSLTIAGRRDVQTSIICSASQNASAGILLWNISGSVEIHNLDLKFCGSKVDKEYDGDTYLSALAIIWCGDVQLSHITIERSNGIGLMIIVNQTGAQDVINIESSIFRENNLHSNYIYYSNKSISDLDTQAYGGGGVYVAISNNIVQMKQTYLPVSTVLQFQNCTFENNTASTSCHDHIYTNVEGKAHEGCGRGGGVYLILDSNTANIHCAKTGISY